VISKCWSTWLGLAFVAAAGSFMNATAVASEEKLEDTISYLLNYVATSKATFIRNGTSHTPAEAAAHIKAKYEHFKADIRTPEDFIRLSASKSLMSGKPYLVRTPEGKEIRLDEWLTEALKAHRAGAGD
jgi:Family of unknown function (DUF5329)